MAEFKNITPDRFRCDPGLSCPSIHISEDGKKLRIVGAMIYHTLDREEAMIEISADLIRSALGCQGNTGECSDEHRATAELSPQERSSPSGAVSLSQAEISEVHAREIGRIGGWAPGSYICMCFKCKKEFIGDKRAIQCLPCAIKMVQESLACYTGMYNRILKTFDENETAGEFLNEDGEGGLSGGVHRMACEIVSLRHKLRAKDGSPKGGNPVLGGSVHDSLVGEADASITISDSQSC